MAVGGSGHIATWISTVTILCLCTSGVFGYGNGTTIYISAGGVSAPDCDVFQYCGTRQTPCSGSAMLQLASICCCSLRYPTAVCWDSFDFYLLSSLGSGYMATYCPVSITADNMEVGLRVSAIDDLVLKGLISTTSVSTFVAIAGSSLVIDNCTIAYHGNEAGSAVLLKEVTSVSVTESFLTGHSLFKGSSSSLSFSNTKFQQEIGESVVVDTVLDLSMIGCDVSFEDDSVPRGFIAVELVATANIYDTVFHDGSQDIMMHLPGAFISLHNVTVRNIVAHGIFRGAVFDANGLTIDGVNATNCLSSAGNGDIGVTDLTISNSTFEIAIESSGTKPATFTGKNWTIIDSPMLWLLRANQRVAVLTEIRSVGPTGGFQFPVVGLVIAQDWNFTASVPFDIQCNHYIGGLLYGSNLNLHGASSPSSPKYRWTDCRLQLEDSWLEEVCFPERHFHPKEIDFTHTRVVGGSIHARETVARFVNTSFTRRNSNKAASLELSNSNVTFTHCVFEGIYEDGEDDGSATPVSPVNIGRFGVALFNDTQFINTRGFPSGGISAGPFTDITVTNCLFRGCTGSTAGAMDLMATIVDISNSRLDSCTSVTGGALSGEDVIGRFSGTIQNCTALSSSGGAATISGNSRFKFEDVDISGIALAGGGISVEDSSKVTIEKGLFGGGVSLTTGGALLLKDTSTTIVTDSVFVGNAAKSWGGAVYASSYAYASFSRCVFSNNTTPAVGGAAMASDYSEMDIDRCLFTANSATSSGGALVYGGAARGSVNNTVFENNFSGSRGGGVALEQLAHPKLSGLTFAKNSANVGGGLSVEGHTTVIVHDLLFESNTAVTNGGGLFISGDTSLVASDIILEGNTASLSGGGIYCGKYADLHLHSAIVRNSSAAEGAGLCFTTSHRCTLERLYVESNYANGHGGGALFVQGGAQFMVPVHSISDSVFEKNHAKSGGGVSLLTSVELATQSCIFRDNHALDGGGLILSDVSTLNANGTLFTNNRASGGGGILANYGSVVRLHRCEVTNNKAMVFGGGAVMRGPSDSVVEHSSISGNNAHTGGGLMLFPTSKGSIGVTIMYSEVSGNTAVATGGGIAIGVQRPAGITGVSSPFVVDDEASTEPIGGMFIAEHLLISNNTSQNGGGISMALGKCPGAPFNPVFGPNVTVESNHARQMGGGVFYELSLCEKPQFEDTVFRNNSATWGGGNMGWYLMRSKDQACRTCQFNPPFYQGYGTITGLATYPTVVNMDNSGCPAVQSLDGSPFTLSLYLTDGFNTIVKGGLSDSRVSEMDMRLAATSDCYFDTRGAIKERRSKVEEDSGLYRFLNVSLSGKNGTRCAMAFEPDTPLQFDFVDDYFCSTLLAGCESGNEVSFGSITDTCVPVGAEPQATGKTVLTIVLLSMVTCLFVIVCTMYGLLFFQWKRQRNRLKRATFVNLDIDDLLLEKVSLYELLSDPDITVIPWEELEVGERIGVGASGIVSEGYWSKPLRTRNENALKDSLLRDDVGFHSGSLQSPDALFQEEEAEQHSVQCERKKVAIKELHLPVDELDPDQLHEFISEIRLMNALSHPSVVLFMGVAYDDLRQRLCLVTELMGRGSLSDLLYRKGEGLSVPLKTKMALDATAGMIYLHGQNIIHRDLKTQNLLVNDNWDCKISDFGVSTVKNRTMTMTCIGTPLYMAPEVLQCSRYSEKADVYSFGVVLVELYTGKPAYDRFQEAGASDAQLMYRIVAEQLQPDLSELPQSLQELVADCLVREPTFRPSFDEIQKRLRRIQKKSPQEPSAYL